MSKAAFKIKILKGGYKSKLDEQEVVSEKSNAGFMGIGLVEEDVIHKMHNKFNEIEGKFIALFNSKGHVHIAWTNPKKLEIPNINSEIQQLHQDKQVIIDSTSQGGENPELDEVHRKIQQLEEKKIQLMVEPQIITKG